MALLNAFEDSQRGYRAAAILALVGVVNIPIIKFSVDWWSTLHQPASVLRLDGPTIHPSMLWPLLIVALGFKLYYVRSEEHTSELQSLMRISYAVLCLKTKINHKTYTLSDSLHS